MTAFKRNSVLLFVAVTAAVSTQNKLDRKEAPKIAPSLATYEIEDTEQILNKSIKPAPGALPRSFPINTQEGTIIEFAPGRTVQLHVEKSIPLSSDKKQLQLSGSVNQGAGQFITTEWKGCSYTSIHLTGHGEFEVIGQAENEHKIISEVKSLSCEQMEGDAISVNTQSSSFSESIAVSTQTNASPITLDCDGTGTAYLDIIGFYNHQARIALGGSPSDLTDAGAIESKIISAVAMANIVFENSAIPIKLRLTYVGPIDYHYPLNEGFSRAINEVRDPTDGILDGIHTLRNEYHADIISLWLDSDVTGGLAYVLTPSSGSEAAIHAVNSGNSILTFSHELGHNMGCRHHRASYTTLPSGWHPYSYGHTFTGTDNQNYASIMVPIGSLNALNATRIPYFSNSAILYQGTPTGAMDTEECARSMTENRFCIEHFLQAEQPLSDLTLLPSGTNAQLQITQGFVGHSYQLETSYDLNFWTPVDTHTTDSTGKATGTAPFDQNTQFYRWTDITF